MSIKVYLKEAAREMVIMLIILCNITKEYQANSSKRMPRFSHIHLVLGRDDKWNLIKTF
jgi:hypothetical protein